MIVNPLTATDFYKTDHRRQYPDGTTEIYSNFTPRSSQRKNKHIINFGLQYFIKDFLLNSWNEHFFKQERSVILGTYKRRMDLALGENAIDVSHIGALHDLGYLPLRIKALPEGAIVPTGVPLLTIVNTHPDFFWLTNYIESAMSSYLWKPITSATTAFEFKKLLTRFAMKTGGSMEFINFQMHDFSFRGMSSLQDSVATGAAHLTSFIGTDSIAAIDFIEEFYNADAKKEVIGCSAPATEHSVMCMGTQEKELETYRRLICETYPEGIISIVSDTWDFWKVITEYIVILKEDILHRKGKVVIRPDSGDPFKIVVGDLDAADESPEYKGTVECLWDIFGGTTTKQGYKILDPHIGLIYGDSISLDVADRILDGLAQKGFCSSNIIFGIGSTSYQYVTRDTFGFAFKATSSKVNGRRLDIFKDPKTDSGTKKSAKGLLRVEFENGHYVLHHQQTESQEKQGELKTIFEDGKLIYEVTLADIRKRINNVL